MKDIGVGGTIAKGYDLFTQSYTGNKFFLTDFLNDFKLENSGKQRELVFKAVKELANVLITIPSEDKKILTGLHLYTAYRINLQENSITLYYTNEMVELLKNKPQYSRIEFEQLKNLTSKYAIKWYMNFASYRYKASSNNDNVFWKIYSFDEIREFFKLGNKYKSDSEFKKNVIDNPIKEINDNVTIFHVKIIYQKKIDNVLMRKRLTHVKFEIVILNTDKFSNITIDQIVDALSNNLNQEQKNLIMNYKEKFFEVAKKKYDLLIEKIDLNVNSKNLTLFYLDVFYSFVDEIKKDLLLLQNI